MPNTNAAAANAAILDSLTFGVEIECYVNASLFRARGWSVGGYHRGTRLSGFNFEAQHDGSLSNPPTYGHIGVEFVSGILRGARGLEQIREMCEALAALDARVNDTCGLHVHVYWNDSNSAEALTKLVASVANHELGLFAITGTRRRLASHYARSIAPDFRALDSITDMNQIRTCYAASNRYHTLNLAHVADRRSGGSSAPTVEFRVFAGTTSAIKINSYVMVAVGLVHKALAPRQRKLAYDAPTTVARSVARSGDGAIACERLIIHLNWNRYGRASSRDTVIRFGLLCGLDERAPYIAELRRLAQKFDRPANAPRAARRRPRAAGAPNAAI